MLAIIKVSVFIRFFFFFLNDGTQTGRSVYAAHCTVCSSKCFISLSGEEEEQEEQEEKEEQEEEEEIEIKSANSRVKTAFNPLYLFSLHDKQHLNLRNQTGWL